MNSPARRRDAPIGSTCLARGYVLEKTSEGWVQQHRLVMSKAIGRELFDDETVHHLNGDRADNRIENLEVWSKHQPTGQRVADKLEWCRQFMARYENVQLELEV